MNKQYEEMVSALAKPGIDIKETMTPNQAHLLHMAVGISGEAGELLDAIKKHVIYQKSLDVANVKEEIGDLFFYITGLALGAGVDLDECIKLNQEKLAVRYGSRYSDQAAQERKDKQ